MYTLSTLLRDVAQKHAKVQGKDENGQIDYAEVWNTYIRYIKACMEEKRGVLLSNFCRIGWQAEKKRLGEPTYRPYFALTEPFGRAYVSKECMQKQKGAGGSELCAFEDCNFSKAAIKFSQALTKDNVFSGLRSMVQQIGEIIGNGGEVDIEFGDVGRLTSREREARFHFSAELYKAEGLEPPPGAPVAYSGGFQSTPAFMDSAPKAAQGLGLRGSGVQAPPTPMLPETPAHAQEQFGYPAEPEMSPMAEAPVLYRAPSPAVSEAESLDLGQTAGSMEKASRAHVLTGQQFKREAAFKEAMDRHIGEMESRAGEAMQERAAFSRHVDDCLGQERDEILGKRTKLLENQHFVKQQKLLNEEKRKEARQEDIIAASAHDFPKFTEPAEADMKEFVKGQQARMRSELDDQVRTNMTLKNLQKQRERSMEVNTLEANRAEMAMLRDAERAKKTYDREALATAWNSEIRMKNIWKAIDSHNKVATVGPNLQMQAAPPSRGGESTRSAGRLMTGSSRKAPLGASSSMSRLSGR